MGRSFRRRQRIALYLESGGACRTCGTPLEKGWHADHVVPWSAGGPTTTDNGQALCPKCNMSKGATLRITDTITRRPWGSRALEALRTKIDRGERHLMVNAFCGSGKTCVFLDLANELYRKGIIERVLILTPRVNLCGQFETDWRDVFRPLYGGKVLGWVNHRTNDPPLIRQSGFFGEGVQQEGVAASYGSLVSQPELYANYCREQPTLLIADEAQILGSSNEEGGFSTAAAGCVRRLQELCAFTLQGTGTPIRSDGGPLLNGVYATDPNTDGVRPLLADVEASYLEGVREGYLRQMEVWPIDGTAIERWLDGTPDTMLTVSKIQDGIGRIVSRPGFWRPAVDMACEHLRDIRRDEPRYSMLVGACSQWHAKQINDYLGSKHADLACLLAVSDEPEAHDNLKTFKKGRHQILTTVGMAYVGYDHRWISQVLCLGAFRFPGWLDQFAFRGGRVCPEIPFESQYLWVFGPDDRLFRRWAESRRRDGIQGLRERRTTEAAPPTPGQQRLSEIVAEQVTGVTAIGMKPEDDISDHRRLQAIRKLSRDFDLATIPATKLDAFFRAHNFDPVAAVSSTVVEIPDADLRADMTDREWEAILRKRLSEECRKIDGMMKSRDPAAEWGWSHRKVLAQFKAETSTNVGTSTLREMLNWVVNTLKPQVTKWTRDQSA